jgi:hypothetical protein
MRIGGRTTISLLALCAAAPATAPMALRAVVSAAGAGPYDDAVYVSIERPSHRRGDGLRFTTDGSDPTIDSPVYDGPVFVSQPTTIKARDFAADGTGGPVLTQRVDVRDTTPPTVRVAQYLSVLPQVTVAFSEPVTRESAESLDHYRFDPPMVPSAAQLQGDGTTVLLDLPAGDPPVRLTVVGVRDVSPAGNAMVATTVVVSQLRPAFHVDAYDRTGGAPPMERPVDGLATRASDPWTITCRVRPDPTPSWRAAIVGFGSGRDGRYLCAFGGHVHFWSRQQDVDTEQPLAPDQWQSLAAVWDGRALTLYADGQTIGSGELSLAAADEPVVRLAPLGPWDHRSRFAGSLRDVNVWPVALPPRTVMRLASGDRHD